jgi:hypothetical protein
MTAMTDPTTAHPRLTATRSGLWPVLHGWFPIRQTLDDPVLRRVTRCLLNRPERSSFREIFFPVQNLKRESRAWARLIISQTIEQRAYGQLTRRSPLRFLSPHFPCSPLSRLKGARSRLRREVSRSPTCHCIASTMYRPPAWSVYVQH